MRRANSTAACHSGSGSLSRILGVAESVNISQSGPDVASLPFRMFRDGQELRPEELPMQLAAATGKEVMGGELQIVRADDGEHHAIHHARAQAQGK
jgi:hypothetical protein